MKILLVDDEKKFASMLAKRLTLRGIDVDYAYNGEDAEQKALKKKFDVAVLDVKMPGIGGIELKQRLKKIKPDIKIIFLTGHGSKSDYEKGSQGADHYLPKPIHITELIRILHEIS